MKRTKRRVYHVISIGDRRDLASTVFDIMIVVVILVNLFATLAETFDEMDRFRGVLETVEMVTIIIFTIEYILRLWTAEFLYPDRGFWGAKLAFVFSFYGIIDLLTFFPYYLPIVFPGGFVAFRILRVFRIFRLFKINAQYDAFNVITDVLYEKKNQLFSSVCLVFMLMIASSLGMYTLEHNAQPESFSNAFSGIWWATSTLLTVGYGDIYPVTYAGKILAIIISFLGVGMVAIPTGIISAGFVEKYTSIKRMMTQGEERDVRFIVSKITPEHAWCGKSIGDIVLPPQLLAVVVMRGEEQIVPNGDTVLRAEDAMVLAGRDYADRDNMNLREIFVGEEHPWVGEQVRDLDVSRQELLVSIERKGRMIIPSGESEIRQGDVVLLYRKGRPNRSASTGSKSKNRSGGRKGKRG